jgi:hypothetical protein
MTYYFSANFNYNFNYKHSIMELEKLINSKNSGNILVKKTISNNNLSNPLLKRLIDEVKFENQNNISAYNRTHNRHNRGR